MRQSVRHFNFDALVTFTVCEFDRFFVDLKQLNLFICTRMYAGMPTAFPLEILEYNFFPRYSHLSFFLAQSFNLKKTHK